MNSLVRHPLPLAASAIAGAGLAVGLGALAAARRGKALHPRGVLGEGTLIGLDGAPGALPSLAHGSSQECQVRWSRAIGVPGQTVDIEGLALRGQFGDLLFASTGASPWGRLVLRFRALTSHGVLTTLLPVERTTAGGMVQFALRPVTSGAADETATAPAAPYELPDRYEFAQAGVTGGWRAVGELRVRWTTRDDETLRFDPVARPFAGTRPPRWVTLLREPAYRASRALGH